MLSDIRDKLTWRLAFIRTQLFLGMGGILLLSLFIAVIGYWSLSSFRLGLHTTVEEANRVRELSLEIENCFLLARQDEIRFLDNWRSMGFETASEEYVAPNQANLALAWERLDELERLVQAASDEDLRSLEGEIDEIRPLLETYASTFQTAVNQIQERSRPDGLESSLRGVLDELGKSVAPWPSLIELVLQIRSEEQSYLATANQEYVSRIRASVNQFTYLFQGSDLGDQDKTQLNQWVGDYMTLLDQLVDAEGNIEYSTTVFQDVTVDINQVAGRIGDKSAAGLVRANERLDDIGRQASLALFVATGLALFLGVVSTAWLARRIILPLDRLSRAARRVGQGDLGQPVVVSRGGELAALGRAFNDMAGQLRDLISNLERRNVTLQATVQQYADFMEQVSQGDLAARLPLNGDEQEQASPLIALGRQLNRMTTSLQAQIEQERRQLELIQEQQEAIRRLSSPVIPVMERIIIMPMVGSIDSRRAREITRALLAGIGTYRAKVVILDVTGVPAMDSGVINHLNKTIQAARLKGAQTIITGISDAVAESIIDLGVDWSHVVTLGNLRAGLGAALDSMGFKVFRESGE
jgi:anti-anti-sigma regulatory factor/HAMP domain-containing protein